jgi:hypothetical protein
MSDDILKQYEEVRAAFNSQKVFTACEGDLKRYIRALSLHAILNPSIKHQAAVMASTITQIQTSCLIERINRQNTRLAWIVLAITFFSLAASLIQILVALNIIHR